MINNVSYNDCIQELSIVIPAYNEESNLARIVLEAEAVLKNHAAERLEWILVDDGSTDSTWSEITNLADSMPDVIPLKHTTNRGLGAALWTGMAQASSEWCTWMPADGQFAPQSYVDMMRFAEGSDLVILMRDDDRAWQRRILTIMMYGLMRIVLGFDAYGYSGVFLVRRRILQDVPLYSTTGVQNFAVVLHCQKNEYRIQQTCTVIQPRMSGKSKVSNVPTMLKVFYDIMKLTRQSNQGQEGGSDRDE